MNNPARHRPHRDRGRDAGLMFWYWLPVTGALISLAFILLGWLIGS